MAAEASKSSSSADSYIGSLISLTSKSEIRYEGVLYSINTEESSIGLRNVRSFGSEGRKKDGPQIPPSDKVYEFILFRGTDIKDLLVKSTPPVQTASNIDNDPAIIQSHYPRPPAPSTNLPPAVGGSPANMNSHTPQMGHPGSSFPGVMPLYHHGVSLGSWGASPPPSIKGNLLPMPAYWPGMYGPPNVLPHLHQQTFLPPPPGLSMPPSLQQPLPYPGLSAPPQAAAPNVAGSSSPPTTSSSSAMIGFGPPPPAGALNVPNSSSPLVASSSSSHAQTSTSLPSLSLSLQQPMPYSVFNAPAQAAALNVPNSSSIPFTTISSSAILAFNPPPPAGALNVPSSSSPFLTACTALTSSHLPSLSLPVVPSLSTGSGRTTSSVFNKGLNSVLPSEALNAGLPTLVSLTISGSETISTNPPVCSKVNTVSISTLPSRNLSQPVTSVVSSSMTLSEKEVLIPSLVTPDQLFQSEQSQISSQSSQIARKDVEVVQVSSSSEKSVTVLKEKEVQPPILPLPPAPRPYHKPNGATQVRHNYRGSGRGRERGRGTGGSRPVTRFTEDFDFTAMNEKFNKDEVWDHLGKSNKIHSQDKEGDEDDEDDYKDEDGAELLKIEVKPVYNKDDFFDSLSSNTLGNEPQNARPRFSEQVKLDTETFGEFARYRGARGGRGARHGGRGSNFGRAYGYAGSGRGYGYSGRGRGRQLSSQAS